MPREILQFRIRGYTPETLSLARLADYLEPLADLMGATDSVHFDRIVKGSAVVQVWVPDTESERVVQRVRSARSDSAPDDVRRAYNKIDALLRENRASGEIRRKAGGQIIAFPGVKAPQQAPIVVTDFGEAEGVVIRVGGKDKTIPVHLLSATNELLPCEVRNREMAREFAAMLYGDPVRVRGNGTWERNPDGRWKLVALTIVTWEKLDPDTIAEVFERIRANDRTGWRSVSNPDRELSKLRHGS